MSTNAWWTDESRMLEPMFLTRDSVEAVKRHPTPNGVAYVWPGEPGYDEATEAMIERSVNVLEWSDRKAGTVLVFGKVLGVLRHGYITTPVRRVGDSLKVRPR